MEGKLLINGKWENPVSGESLLVIDPSDGSEFSKIARGTADDVEKAVVAAQSALDGGWGRMIPVERGRLLHALGEQILEHENELVELESRDVGKPLRQSRVDVRACARYFEFYAGAVDKIHGQTIPYLEDYTVLTLREPHGVTGHIIPWNYPMQIIGRTIGGALAMGNACVLKPGEEASLTSLKIGELSILPRHVALDSKVDSLELEEELHQKCAKVQMLKWYWRKLNDRCQRNAKRTCA